MEPGHEAPGVEAAETELFQKSSRSEVPSGLFLGYQTGGRGAESSSCALQTRYSKV